MSFIKEFQHLKISLQDIKSATNNFGDNKCIGRGGFGKVYLGELLLSEGLITVAVKRLDTALGQGATEFWKEIMLLSQYKHENLVSLVGFCDESGENILVYEYLCNKSLDLYLSSNKLSWRQRLCICIGSARGLQYLHDPHGTQQRVLHRDIKSANILLDANWNAKISDFGLSKIGPANQQFSFLVSNGVGTIGYCDPLYVHKGFLTKESDVYSFGVVLFEVLCGRRCVQSREDIAGFLTALVQKCYEEKKLHTIIDNHVKKEISRGCLERFSAIAHQCLNIDHTKRPLMAEIVKELEIALQYQVEYEFEKEKKLKHHIVLASESDEYWETKLPRDWEIITKMFNIPRAIFTDKKKLVSHLQNGFPCGKDDKFFWINDDGKKCVLLSATRFINGDNPGYPRWVFQRDLRFSRVAEFYHKECHDISCQIKASMLSLGTTYAANMVFKYHTKPNEDVERLKLTKIRWKMEELCVNSMHFAKLTSDGWYNIKMCCFINDGPNADFDILLEELSYFEDPNKSELLILGIEFQPAEMDEEDMGDDVYWETKLPKDYQRYIQMSDKPLHYTKKRELYSLLCEGFLSYNGLWFSLCKSTGGICLMLPATHILSDVDYIQFDTLTLSESRFKEVRKVINMRQFYFRCDLPSPMLSSKYSYACYLVFKYLDNQVCPDDTKWGSTYALDGLHQHVVSSYSNFHLANVPNFNFHEVNIPTIKLKNDYGLQDLSNTQEITEPNKTSVGYMGDTVQTLMEQRNDGWMEVMLCESFELQDHKSLTVTLTKAKGGFNKMIVEGIEFRPMQRRFS